MNDRSKDRRDDEAATAKAHRAALEALFAPKSATPPTPPAAPKRESVRMIKAKPAETDARTQERSRLVEKLLAAQGRAAVARAEAELVKAGFDVPATQEVQLQLLEHGDEERVRMAIRSLAALLDTEPARRITVLDARLRRLEDCAEELETREHATTLRKKLGPTGRGAGR